MNFLDSITIYVPFVLLCSIPVMYFAAKFAFNKAPSEIGLCEFKLPTLSLAELDKKNISSNQAKLSEESSTVELPVKSPVAEALMKMHHSQEDGSITIKDIRILSASGRTLVKMSYPDDITPVYDVVELQAEFNNPVTTQLKYHTPINLVQPQYSETGFKLSPVFVIQNYDIYPNDGRNKYHYQEEVAKWYAYDIHKGKNINAKSTLTSIKKSRGLNQDDTVHFQSTRHSNKLKTSRTT